MEKYTQTKKATLTDPSGTLPLTGDNIKKMIGSSRDVMIRKIFLCGDSSLPVTLVCVDGMINSKTISDDVLKPLAQDIHLKQLHDSAQVVEMLEHGSAYYAFTTVETELNRVIAAVFAGNTAIVFDQVKKAVLFDAKGYQMRSIQEPSNENVVKGAKDSFVEVLRVNTSLVRRRLKSQNLIIDETAVGKETMTTVSILYLDGIVDPQIVERVKKKIDQIDIEGVLTPGNIEEYISDNPKSIFPQMIYTEQPDKFCANLLDGRVGLLIDGMPTAYLLPVTFNSYMQTPEDYAQNYAVSSILRIIRYICVFVTLLLPGFYISMTTFQQEMLPTQLALSIRSAKMNVPFMTFMEVIGMLLAFEILIEAGYRLPKAIGQSISIIGGLILGQAAVEAQLVSPVVIIVVATTGITGFTMTNQDMSNALRIWRFILVILSSIGGLFGLIFGCIILLLQLCSYESYSISYLAPYVDNDDFTLRDTLLRAPLWKMKRRPDMLHPQNKQKQK